MGIKSRVADLRQDGQLLLELDNRCFNRIIDYPSASVKEELGFLSGSSTYICFDDDKAVGFFAYKDNSKGEVELKTMAVIPEYRGRGIGKEMMAYFLQSNKGKDLFLVTHPQNSGAIVLYLKSGFAITGWNENYYGDGQPRLMLKRKA
jgi:[ribosomal protein S18]-alanine N-acetyltransferase